MTNMTNTAWAHLANAAHIDRVLAHVRANPEKWDAARDALWNAARVVALDAALDAARDAARGAARGAAWDAAWDAAWGAAWGAARGACAALVAWDKVGDLVGQPPQLLKFLSDEGVHAATLLLPASIAMENT